MLYANFHAMGSRSWYMMAIVLRRVPFLVSSCVRRVGSNRLHMEAVLISILRRQSYKVSLSDLCPLRYLLYHEFWRWELLSLLGIQQPILGTRLEAKVQFLNRNYPGYAVPWLVYDFIEYKVLEYSKLLIKVESQAHFSLGCVLSNDRNSYSICEHCGFISLKYWSLGIVWKK